MKGDPKVIEYLQKSLKLELTAINQYFLHSRMYKDWGITKLAAKEYEESIDEMKHADKLIERRRVTINGKVPEMGTKVAPGDEVRVVGVRMRSWHLQGVVSFVSGVHGL